MILSTKILILVILVILSAFFSGSEIALFSLSRLKVKHLIRKKTKGAKTVERLKSNPRRLLVTILIGNNVVNIGASALATSIIYEISRSYAVSITTGIMTLIILLFGEIAPKSLASRYNEKISLSIARLLLTLEIVFFPVIILFEGFTRLVTPKRKAKPLVTEEELKTMISVGEELGHIEESQEQMMYRIFRFDDLTAKDIMTKKSKIIAVKDKTTLKDVAEVVCRYTYSKIPVYRGNKNHIKWFVHRFDLQKAMLDESNKDKKVRQIMKPILSVPSSKRIDSLLKLFQEREIHIAVVTDRSKKTVGLVTLEDVLEEIVGEIIEEHERLKPIIK